MPNKMNLAGSIKELLPENVVSLIRRAGEAARKQQQRLYLVGGVVRDILLERHNLDLDLVVEGDAIKLALEIASYERAKVTVHPHFGTAKLRWPDRSLDLTTARSETYTKPGALPTVKPGTIKDDLSRRDFTINAMAIALNPPHFGDIIDPHGGRKDVEKKLVRVLHEQSFRDDATRIWRALRYEQRLDFHLEKSTLELLKEGIAWLDTVSGDRIRHELENVLREELPEKVLSRAGALGVLDRIYPSLKSDDWLTETFKLARERCQPDATPNIQLYLVLLCYRLNLKEAEKLISYMHLPNTIAQTLRETIQIKGKINELSIHGLAPSHIYKLVHGYSTIALTANSLATNSATVAEHIELYMNLLRYVKPALGGEDLRKMGIPEGPSIKEILQKLCEARLDGKITSKREEEEMVKAWYKK
jgi:tRNA nucleotidyltransferase (CCA-adding enzyme)